MIDNDERRRVAEGLRSMATVSVVDWPGLLGVLKQCTRAGAAFRLADLIDPGEPTDPVVELAKRYKLYPTEVEKALEDMAAKVNVITMDESKVIDDKAARDMCIASEGGRVDRDALLALADELTECVSVCAYFSAGGSGVCTACPANKHVSCEAGLCRDIARRIREACDMSRQAGVAVGTGESDQIAKLEELTEQMAHYLGVKGENAEERIKAVINLGWNTAEVENYVSPRALIMHLRERVEWLETMRAEEEDARIYSDKMAEDWEQFALAAMERITEWEKASKERRDANLGLIDERETLKSRIAKEIERGDNLEAQIADLHRTAADKVNRLHGDVDRRDETIRELRKQIADMEPRLMPEGYEWPRWEDTGELVKLGETCARQYNESMSGVIGAITFQPEYYNLVESDCMTGIAVSSYGERVKRPESEVLDADGVPIHEGDTVYDTVTGRDYRVVALIDTDSDRCVRLDSREIGEFIATRTRLTHTPPDTWESIEQDARQLDIDLDGESGCDYPRMSCVRDLVSRCKKLAGVDPWPS